MDIAEHLGISKATVNQTINRLVKKGFLTSKPYRAIHLTKKGKYTATHARQRHKIVYDFLIAIGLDKETAELDSEGMEHHVGNKTLSKLKNLTNKLKKIIKSRYNLHLQINLREFSVIFKTYNQYMKNKLARNLFNF